MVEWAWSFRIGRYHVTRFPLAVAIAVGFVLVAIAGIGLLIVLLIAVIRAL